MLINRQTTEDKPLELKFGVKPNTLIRDKVLHQSSADGFKVWCKTLVLWKEKIKWLNVPWNKQKSDDAEPTLYDDTKVVDIYHQQKQLIVVFIVVVKTAAAAAAV